nr:MAG TPA: hypothetical protein [Caudoviricetes sp.]
MTVPHLSGTHLLRVLSPSSRLTVPNTRSLLPI